MMFGGMRATAYSHKVRRILKERHGIWLTGLPIGSPAFQTFLEICLHCFFDVRNTAERAAERYANACHNLGRHPQTFKEFGDAERMKDRS